MLGETIGGRYLLHRLLGQGGMGAVYEAEHTGTRRRVAVKVIIGTELTKNVSLVQRFEREARAAGSIDTQHIVQVLDTGTDPVSGVPYMVMELLKGEDLQGALKRVGALPPDVALRLVGQACIGLMKAHEAGVVHRDIKPANLFLARREDGEIIVKVVDFGVAKIKLDATGSDEVHLTRTGSMLGSPLYMSPEQAVGKKSLDHRTDVWSLGAVLYEALAGTVAHADADTLGALIMAICSESAAPLSDIAPWVPYEAARIAHAALAIDVGARLQSMEAMLDAIRAVVPGGLAVRADMIVSVSPEERAVVRPALERQVSTGAITQPAQSAFGASGTQIMPESGDRVSRTVPAAPPPPGILTTGDLADARSLAHDGGSLAAGTSAGITVTSADRPPRSALRIPLLLVAAALGAGGIAFAATRLGAHAEVPVAARSASVPDAPTPAPTASGPVVSPAPASARSVKVGVEPVNAVVEVDGVSVPVTDGSFEISGALGTAHRVRVRLDKLDATSDVAITEAGALPATVRLDVPRVGGKPIASGVAPRPSAAPTAKPKAHEMTRGFE